MDNKSCNFVSKKSSNENTEYLVYGYCKLINMENQLIPTCIIELIIIFYRANTTIIYLQQNDKSSEPPLVSVANLDDETNIQCMISPISKTYDKLHHYLDENNYVCYVKGFNIPHNITSIHDKLYENHVYDVAFLSANNDERDQVIAYIFDIKNIPNVYYWKLPRAKSNSLYSSYPVYSSKYGLIAIGHCVNIFNFDTLKWTDIAMKTVKESLAAAMVGDDKLICCGGYVTNGDVLKCCDLYDLNLRKWTNVADMNQERYYHGICFDKYTNNRVFIGGGIIDTSDTATKSFEYLDINKNEWISLSDTNGEHETHSIIWNDDINIINIASTYAAIFERNDLRENKWHTFIKSDDEKLNKLFGVNVKIHSDHALICL